jgi:selenocysteine lyase/cysteine desulfurase
MPSPVIQAINDYLELELTTGGYESANAQKEAIAQTYGYMAALLNTKAANIAITANATDSFFRAMSSIPFQPGDMILTTNDDYVSNQISFLIWQKRFGVKLVRVANGPDGDLDLDAMGKAIKKHRPKLVAVTHVPTYSGLVQPIAEVGRMCRENEIIFLVDACQSIGQLSLDVEQIHCDFLSGTSRKFLRGPRGIGFLYVSDRILAQNYEPLMLDLRGANWIGENEYTSLPDARRFELWEHSYALILGMGAAAKYALDIGIENIEARVKELADYTRNKLSDIPGVKVLDQGKERCGIVVSEIEGRKIEEVKPFLDAKHINTSVTDGRAAQTTLAKQGVEWGLRISPHYYNTLGEIDLVIKKLGEILG